MTSFDLFKKLTILGDIEDILLAVKDLADQLPALRPPFDKLVADFETVVSSLSFDGIALVTEDVKTVYQTVVSTYNSTDPAVIELGTALDKLISDLGS